METSLIISAIGILAYSFFWPWLDTDKKVSAMTGRKSVINKYFGDKLNGTEIDFSQVYIEPDVYGTLQVRPRQITTYCDDRHWQKVNRQYLIH